MSEYERAVDALLYAFVTQVYKSGDRKFSKPALELLADEGRETVRVLLGCIGHLVHYDSTGEDNEEAWLADLFERLIATLRSRHPEKHGLRPGDFVEMEPARPDLYLQAGRVMRVYWVGDDGNVDLGYASLADEYGVSTVLLSEIRKCPAA